MPTHINFSLVCPIIANALESTFYVSSGKITKDSIKWSGIWDTGATQSCISSKIVSSLKLSSDGQTIARLAHGQVESDIYTVSIALPNMLSFNNIPVLCLDANPRYDVIIGMDIISLGDFSISNFNGRTIMNFRYPSKEDIHLF